MLHNSLPARFRRSGRKQRVRAKTLMQLASRNFEQVTNPHLFTLNHKHLDIPTKHSKASSLYLHDTVNVWKDAIKQTFKGCLYFSLEVGHGDYKAPKRGLIHAHIIASANDGPDAIKGDTQRYKPVNNLEGVFIYLSKPSEPYSFEAMNDLISTRMMHGKPPHLRGFLASKHRKVWNIKNKPPLLALRPLKRHLTPKLTLIFHPNRRQKCTRGLS
jgi:hypothetical protein